MIDRSKYKTGSCGTDLSALIVQDAVVSFDLETTSKHPAEAEIIGVGLAFSEDEAYYFDVRVMASTFLKGIMSWLAEMGCKLVGQNLKYDFVVLDKYGLMPKEASFDTLLAEYLLDPNLRRGRSLDDLSRKYLTHTCISFKDIVAATPNKSFTEVPLVQATQYCCEDVDIALRLAKILGPRLRQAGLERVFYDLEMPLMPVLAKMEARGVRIDTAYLLSLEVDFTARKADFELAVYTHAGKEFNINSPKQLQEVLYDNLKIQKGKETKTGWSTSADTLKEHRQDHPIIDAILGWRGMSKLLSTYVSNLPQMVNVRTGRLHGSFNQAIAATGRLTSSSPNLQNIPARGEDGASLRKAFIAESGFQLIVADYSQIELRVFAHYSEDTLLVQAFQEGRDIHSETAKKIFKVDEPTKDQRTRAKTINFGILYGMSHFRLAREQNISVEEAEAFFEEYFNALPGVKSFMAASIKMAKRTGYAETLLGRKRPLPDLRSESFSKQKSAERMAVSTVIQGSAADIMKRAMLDVDSALKGTGAFTIMSVHDELVVECPNNKVDEVMNIVQFKMIHAIKLIVPIEVSIVNGDNWGCK